MAGRVPESFDVPEIQPDAELQLQPLPSLEQVEAIRPPLDAGSCRTCRKLIANWSDFESRCHVSNWRAQRTSCDELKDSAS